MREIKFKAWDNLSGRFVDLRAIEWRRNDDYSDKIIKEIHYDKGRICYPEIKNFIILLQYSGLKDKNGKDIYEGDIVKTRNGVYVFEKITETYLTNSQSYECHAYGDNEIIGNIYQNPELLEGGV